MYASSHASSHADSASDPIALSSADDASRVLGRDSAAEDLLRRSNTLVLGAAPELILQTLGRLGSLRFVTTNAAALAEHVAASPAVADGGGCIGLDRGVELWTFPRNWWLTLAVQEPISSASLVSLRAFDRAGSPLLEIHVAARGNGGARIRACLARWQAPRGARPGFDRRVRAPGPRDPSASPGLEATLAAARRDGSEQAVRLLETRHGLSRLEALMMLGAPWARRVQRGGVHELFHGIACHSLHTRMLVGNTGASYVRAGHMPCPRLHGGVVRLRERGFGIEVRESAVAQLWAVRLHADGGPAGATTSSLEAFDVAGDPAFLLFGGRDRGGRESPAWQAFVDGAGRRTALDVVAGW